MATVRDGSSTTKHGNDGKSFAGQRSFLELKNRLVSVPVLTLRSPGEEFVIYSDASRQGLGCVSMQNGKIIAYASKASHAQLSVTSVGALFANFQVRPILIDTVRETQTQDLVLSKLKEEVSKDKDTDYTIRDDGTLVMGNRLCVPDDSKLKEEILEEAHSSAYAMHPGSTKMYHVLKEHYWWHEMKR
ncbi:uncharacterized protein LOC111411357 [Olea europaea var. sylvestris]|uniref:uncharacterized protein LOC111411357 n=1 Tax=Olea europaea var. sylvestris TaxID=158386 RepID=UPI000C1D4E18|nr:uncharacterized protein LOC111411357 [Olea europaea var. sylvestris]